MAEASRIHPQAVAQDLVEHDLDVVAGVPVAVVVEAAGLLEHAGQLDRARPHEFDGRLGRFVPVLERPLLLGLAPEHLGVCSAAFRPFSERAKARTTNLFLTGSLVSPQNTSSLRLEWNGGS